MLGENSVWIREYSAAVDVKSTDEQYMVYVLHILCMNNT